MVDLKLTLKVLHNNIKSWGPAEDIINDYSCVAGFVEDDASGAGKFLPCCIHVMDEDNEDDRSIDRAKGHHQIGVFRAIGASKSQFGLE